MMPAAFAEAWMSCAASMALGNAALAAERSTLRFSRPACLRWNFALSGSYSFCGRSDAQYWLAESHYVTQKFDEALGAFEVVINDHPRSRKVPDALLKMGYCNYELERWEAARNALRRVQGEYPETTAARLAGQRLTRMEEEGV